MKKKLFIYKQRGDILIMAIFFTFLVLSIIGLYLFFCEKESIFTHSKKQKNEATYLVEAITNWVIEELANGRYRQLVRVGEDSYGNVQRNCKTDFLNSELGRLINKIYQDSNQTAPFANKFNIKTILLTGNNNNDKSNDITRELDISDYYNNYPKQYLIDVWIERENDPHLKYVKARSKTKVSIMPENVCDYALFLPLSSELQFNVGGIMTLHQFNLPVASFGGNFKLMGPVYIETRIELDPTLTLSSSYSICEDIDTTYNIQDASKTIEWSDKAISIKEFVSKKIRRTATPGIEANLDRLQEIHDDPTILRWPWKRGEEVKNGKKGFCLYLNGDVLDALTGRGYNSPPWDSDTIRPNPDDNDREDSIWPVCSQYLHGPLNGRPGAAEPRTIKYSPIEYKFSNMDIILDPTITVNPPGGNTEDNGVQSYDGCQCLSCINFPDPKSPIEGLEVLDYNNPNNELDYQNFIDNGPREIIDPITGVRTSRVYTYVGSKPLKAYLVEKLCNGLPDPNDQYCTDCCPRCYARLGPRTEEGVGLFDNDLYKWVNGNKELYAVINNRKHGKEIKYVTVDFSNPYSENRNNKAPKDLRRYDLAFLQGRLTDPKYPGIFFLFEGQPLDNNPDLTIEGGFTDCPITIATKGDIVIARDIVNSKDIPTFDPNKPELTRLPHQIGIIAKGRITIKGNVKTICASLMCNTLNIEASSDALYIYGSLLMEDIHKVYGGYSVARKTYIINPSQNRKMSAIPVGFSFLDTFKPTILSINRY